MTFETLEPRVLLTGDSVITFNEVMYHAADDNDSHEWVELHNQLSVDVDLSGWSIAGGIDYQFDSGTVLAGGDYLVVANNPIALQALTGFDQAVGPYFGSLSNSGETVQLLDNNSRVLDELDYADANPWPVAPDGSGATLAKKSEQLATADPASWSYSTQVNGSPGATNSIAPSPLLPGTLRLSEIAGVNDAYFFVELENTGSTAVDLTDYVIRVEGQIDAVFTVPSQSLAGGECIALHETTLGFRPSGEDRVFLLGPEEQTILDATRAGNTLQARSVELNGRWQTPLEATPGAENSFSFNANVVINEILYNHAANLGVPSQSPSNRLLSFDDAWRYNELGVDLGTSWASTDHDVGRGGWQQGQGLLAQESSSLPAQINTPLNLGPTTYYFETDFEFKGKIADVDKLLLSYIVDDGAVFYLNGVQVARFNLAGSLGEPIDAATLAAPSVTDANLSALLEIPHGALAVGANRLSVEVHQSSAQASDIVFGAELIAQTATAEAVPYTENLEEWLELYNHGAAAVDLSGWRLNDAVDYTFPSGTMLQSGGYLVVARDATSLAAEYPTMNIVGSYQGSLANSGENIELLDSVGNIADEVHYFDGGRWPGFADGGGSSLELKDPGADNSKGEAWADSDEAASSGWKTYTYRGTATNSIPGAPTLWQEFAFGLLDGAGELLIDDISVVEDPDGAAIERIQNGAFDAGTANAWRLLGNHQDSEVISDNGNFVLHVVADGATEYQGNQIETTFANNALIIEGQEYEISYRAKWLTGSRQLNSRLYFDRLAKTTILVAPEQNGTPGEQNSRFTNNLGPTYDNLRHGPTLPSPLVPTTVSVEAADPDGIAAMILWYSAGGESWATTLMTLGPDGRYAGTIPGFTGGTVVHFYVEGQDELGASSTFPAAGTDSRALYQVNDNLVTSALRPDFRAIMTAADSNHLHDSKNVLSNQRLGATVVFGDEIFYDVGVRLKGSFVGRDVDRVGFNIAFNPDQLFRGVHDKVSVDRSTHAVLGVDEVLLKHIANHAGDIPGMHDDIVDFLTPGGQYNSPALLRMAGFDDIYLDSQFENGSDGPVFEYEVIRWATSTFDGTPEGIKRTFPNGYANVDLQDLGSNKEDYRWTNLINNNRNRDDYSAVIELGKVFSLSGNELENAAEQVLDVDDWLRTLAFQSLVGTGDTAFTGGNIHNFRLYVRPEDGRVLYLPWDWDSAFQRSTTASLVGGGNIAKLVNQPVNLRRFQGHLLDIINTTFNPEYMARWTSHYGVVAGQDFSARLNYIAQRANFVLSQLPGQIPFQITTNGGNDFSVPNSSVLLNGNGWIDVSEIRLAGNTNPLTVTWNSDNRWRVQVPVAPGENAIIIEAYNHQGTLIGTDAINVNSAATAVLADASNFRITEINYNPYDVIHDPATSLPLFGDLDVENNQFEFVEFMNTSGQSINLQGVHFTDTGALDYTFGANTLGPSQRIVLVRDRAAFESRYGTELSIAGEFGGGALSNSGESLLLEAANGGVIHEFEYDDSGDWPGRADGKGASLEILGLDSDYSNAANWRSSEEFGGTPGAQGAGPQPNIIVNEIRSHSGAADLDLIELHNVTGSSIDISHWYLSDDSDDLFKFQFMPGTVITDNGFIVVDQGQLGFELDGQFGDDVWLIDAENATGRPLRFADHLDFDATESDVSLGRWPSGDPGSVLFPMTNQSFGAPNSGPMFGQLLVSEVHYNPSVVPPTEMSNIIQEELEFVELYNGSGGPLDVSHWSVDGIGFTFPEATLLADDEAIVVVTFDPLVEPAKAAAFRNVFSMPADARLFGAASGRLNNAGETIKVLRPEDPLTLLSGNVLIDMVTYDDQNPWPETANGSGDSLTRTGLTDFAPFATSWTGHAPTPGSFATSGDFDSDGAVDGLDFLTWQRNHSVGLMADWQHQYGTGASTNMAMSGSAETRFGLGDASPILLDSELIDLALTGEWINPAVIVGVAPAVKDRVFGEAAIDAVHAKGGVVSATQSVKKFDFFTEGLEKGDENMKESGRRLSTGDSAESTTQFGIWKSVAMPTAAVMHPPARPLGT